MREWEKAWHGVGEMEMKEWFGWRQPIIAADAACSAPWTNDIRRILALELGEASSDLTAMNAMALGIIHGQASPCSQP